MQRVFVASVGYIKIGDHWNRSLIDLACEAGRESLDRGSGLRPDQVIVGNMLSTKSTHQENLGATVAESLGLSGVGAYKVEAAGASGGAAIHAACSAIRSGASESCLVIGVEKMRDLNPDEIAGAQAMAESAEFTQYFGISHSGIHALLARMHMHEYDVSRDDLSSFPVLSHANAVSAEHAQFRRKITPEDVSRSAVVADPLRLLDCSSVGDGAAAVLLAGEKAPGSAHGSKVEIVSSSMATDRLNFFLRDDPQHFRATRLAAERALDTAQCKTSDLDFVELSDVFSISGALAVEALQLSKKGFGARNCREGRFDLKGEMPVNTFGGCKGRGNPIGATGVYQVIEAFLQLSGGAKQNQVPDARVGLVQSSGGVDSVSCVHVLRRV